MRWGSALRAFSVIAAVLACDAGLALAQEIEDSQQQDEEADSESEGAGKEKPNDFGSLLDTLTPSLPSFDFLSASIRPNEYAFWAGTDLWHFGRAGYIGMQWAPDGLNRSGFTWRLISSDGIERYSDGAKRYQTQIFRASFLPGWQLIQGKFQLQAAVGPDLEIDVLKPDIPDARTRGLRFGARASIDIWWEPTALTMLSFSASGTTISGTGFSVRGATGWRLFDRFWVGPELSASGDDYSKQQRIGAHLTGWKINDVEWSVAAGYVRDSYSRNGGYGRISMSVRP